MFGRNINRAKRLAARTMHRLTHENPHPNWMQVLATDRERWREARNSSLGGCKVLIATTAGGFVPGAAVESLLAVALTLRGAESHIYLCDEALPACMQAQITTQPNVPEFIDKGVAKKSCPECFWPAYRMFNSLGLPIHRLSQTLTEDEYTSARSLSTSFDVDQIRTFRLDGVNVGEHAVAGALRFFARGDIREEPLSQEVTQKYLEASLLTTYSIRRLLKSYHFDAVVCHHGIYVPQGLIGEVARQQQVRVVNWNVAYRKNCFIFTHGDTYHHALMNEPTLNWETVPWNEAHDTEITDYLHSRRNGKNDWVKFAERSEEDISSIAAELGIDLTRPCIGMLTNVVWDAQLHYPANAFGNMIEWMIETIRYFESRPELQLIIRVHPAEIRGTVVSRQPVVAEIHKAFTRLPSNVFVIPPEREVSTYAVMEKCDSVIIYGTKTGVELTAVGTPVVCAGEAWIRGKGLTRDANSSAEYIRLLDELPLGKRMPPEQVERAKKYAYHFFFRRMIPLPYMTPLATNYPPFKLNVKRLADLQDGKSVGLDVICNGILEGAEFIYPAEGVRDHGGEVENAKTT